MTGVARLLAALCVALWTVGGAQAKTYRIDLILNDSVLDPSGAVYDIGTPTPGGTIYDANNPVTPDVLLGGFIETDGTLGALTAANILSYRISWNFDVHNAFFDQSSFDPLPGYIYSEETVDVSGLFATPTEILVTSPFEIGGGYYFGLGLIGGFGGYGATFSWDSGTLRLDQGGGFFAGTPYLSGVAGFNASEAFPANSALATAAVPLPAGAWLLLGGLGALGLARRRARSA